MQVMRLIKHLYLTHMAGAKRLLGLRPHTLHALQLFYVRARGGGGAGGQAAVGASDARALRGAFRQALLSSQAPRHPLAWAPRHSLHLLPHLEPYHPPGSQVAGVIVNMCGCVWYLVARERDYEVRDEGC